MKRTRKPVKTFRPSPEVESLLSWAQRRSGKTQTRIIEECIKRTLLTAKGEF